jgi:tRNA (guanine-N(7)-)-methyltransferase subunit TRM82
MSRAMPKRPIDICITPDDQTILSADKFGDLYALPVIPKETPSQIPITPEKEPSTSFRPQADETTVHTQRNRRALQNQLDAKKHSGGTTKNTPASFEHTLLLGHVSMLTAVLMAKDPETGRPYILTADRDEHIRVSRGVLDQAHVIESYCLGHEEFVSRMTLVPGKPNLLVSGGGDDELFLWEWCKGRLLVKVNLLRHVQTACPDVEKIAVSGLFAQIVGEQCCVFVTCER